MEDEFKVVAFSVVDSKLSITVDTNKDGQPVLTVLLDIAEVPDEVAALFAKKVVPSTPAA